MHLWKIWTTMDFSFKWNLQNITNLLRYCWIQDAVYRWRPKRDICPTHVHNCQPNISQCEIVQQLRFYMLIPIQFPILLFECRPRRLSNFLTHTTNLHNNTHTTTNPHNKRLSWGTVWMTFSGSTNQKILWNFCSFHFAPQHMQKIKGPYWAENRRRI